METPPGNASPDRQKRIALLMGDNYNLKRVESTKPSKWGKREAAKRSGENAQKALLSPAAEMLAKREEQHDPPTPPAPQGTKAASEGHCRQQPEAWRLPGRSGPEVRGMPQERLPRQPQRPNGLVTKSKWQQKLLDRKLLLPPFRSLAAGDRNTRSNLLYLRRSHLSEEPSCFWETQSSPHNIFSMSCAKQ